MVVFAEVNDGIVKPTLSKEVQNSTSVGQDSQYTASREGASSDGDGMISDCATASRIM